MAVRDPFWMLRALRDKCKLFYSKFRQIGKILSSGWFVRASCEGATYFGEHQNKFMGNTIEWKKAFWRANVGFQFSKINDLPNTADALNLYAFELTWGWDSWGYTYRPFMFNTKAFRCHCQNLWFNFVRKGLSNHAKKDQAHSFVIIAPPFSKPEIGMVTWLRFTA